MQIKLDRHISYTLQKQIYQQVCEALFRGELLYGDMLPSIRVLAGQLGIARNTVTAVYEKLVHAGYVVNLPGIGFKVIFDAVIKTNNREQASTSLSMPPLPILMQPSADVFVPEKDRLYFRLGEPDESAFPWSVWRKWNNTASKKKHLMMTRYQDPQGLSCLRYEIARYLSHSRGIQTESESIVIINGMQEGLSLLAQLFFSHSGEGSVVLESPCYSGAWNLFQSAPNDRVSIPVDEQGIMTDKLPEKPTTLCYVTPSHQYPTGSLLSLARREALLAWSRRVNSYIIEDDYDSAFLYGNQPLPALKSLDYADNVIYLGSFSKTLGPGMRLGYMVCPQALLRPVVNMKALNNHGSSWLYQQFLAEYIHDQSYNYQLGRLEKEYALRRSELQSGLLELFPDGRILNSQTGLHLSLDPHISPQCVEQLRARCLAAGVRFDTLKQLGNGSELAYEKESGAVLMFFGFGGINRADIQRALVVLKRELEQQQKLKMV
ncbi:PLP-dependent aminotransferase family protein [Budvicia diplopodorum]|uniref:MocR-like pyridoxine biosynthesis transcription factor PdxR n=1 Tax=Budvicia diplopodorum TaxID=1119056 RepID=UPI001358076B|nr:PLP-dependent aminotransferase family protein [Budvicia diplopodorum]